MLTRPNVFWGYLQNATFRTAQTNLVFANFGHAAILSAEMVGDQLPN